MLFSQERSYVWMTLLTVVVLCICFSLPGAAQTKAAKTPPVPASPSGKSIPLVIDLGAKQCIPCKMMAPILGELKREYAGVFKTEFIDVWENPDAGQKYGIRAIPTQIFYDASGKEFYRHMGYFSKEQILDTFRKQGIDVKPLAK
jgi:thiol-disulfide isomerase/thioredoxin